MKRYMGLIKTMLCGTAALLIWCIVPAFTTYAGTWLKVGEYWAYTEDGLSFTDGWVLDFGKIYYIQPFSKLMVTGWQIIDNVPYYFGSDGALCVVNKESVTKNDEQLEEDLYKIVNEYRIANGKEPLVENDILNKVAIERASELSEQYSHVRPDGTKCFTLFKSNGYNYKMASENIAYGQETAEEVMETWICSEGHLNNILGDYTDTGIAVYNFDGVNYWCQDFGRR